MRYVKIVGLLLLLTILIGGGYLGYSSLYIAGEVSRELQADEAGQIWYESNDGYDLTAYANNEKITVEGHLTFPPNYNGKAVILSHGSGGKGSMYKVWHKVLHEAGYATFQIDHFKPRNVINVTHGQLRVSEQQMAFDILHAHKLLQTHPHIKKDQIFHMGWSKGAIAGLIASFEKVQNLVGYPSSTARPAGFLSFYPWCGFRTTLKMASPVTILHGDKDDYTPLGLCQTLYSDLKPVNPDLTLKVFENSEHGFDNWSAKVRPMKDALTIRRTSPDCTLRINPETLEIRTEDQKFQIDTFANRKDFLVNCATKGVMYGGNPTHRKTTEKLVLEFLAQS